MTTVVEPTPALGSDIAQRAPRRPVPFGRFSGGAIVVVLIGFSVWSLTRMGFSDRALSRAEQRLSKVFGGLHLSFPTWHNSWVLIGTTVGIVILGTLLAALLSVPVAWIAAANTTPTPFLRWVGRAIGVLTRSVPDVVLALALAIGFGLGSPIPGILAFGIHSVGMISKLFADAIEQSDDGPRLAIRAAGGSRAQEFWSGVFPQVLPSWIATFLHRADINLRGSVILGYAGVSGLGYAMRLAIDYSRDFGRAIGIAIILFVLCILFEIISSTIRRQLLGIAPTGRGVGDRIVRGVTGGRPAPAPRLGGAAGSDADRGAVVTAMLRRPWTGERIRNLTWILVAVAIAVASWFWSGVDLSKVNWTLLWSSIEGFFPWSLGNHTFPEYLGFMFETVEIAFASAIVSLVLAVIFGALAARNIAPNGFVRNTFRVVITIFRAIPETAFAIFLIVITGFGDAVAVVALGVGGVGLLGKLIADSYEEVPAGPERALTAVGATHGQRFLAATWPQGIRALISNSLYLVDTNIRAATILGLVGAGGIGYYIANAAGERVLHPVVTALVPMVMVTVMVTEGIAQFLRWLFR